MTLKDLRALRLNNQQITSTHFNRPEEIISWLVAVQSQVYTMAKWAIGLRLPGLTDKEVETAYNDGKILRTHVLRPTWHFVSPADIRWLLQLTGPRVQAFNKMYYKRKELDAKIFKKCNDVLIKALQGGQQLTRSSIQVELKKAKIKAEGIRLAFLMMQAELDGIICSGKMNGKQFTYALMDDRVPPSKSLDAEEALVVLAMRYFSSRGPATIYDFAWWSGLTLTDTKKAIDIVGNELVSTKIDQREYFYLPSGIEKNHSRNKCFLLPDYDEYGISYKDRSALFESKILTPQEMIRKGYSHLVVMDGVITGSWNFEKKGSQTTVKTKPFRRLTDAEKKLYQQAVQSYSSFFLQKV